MNYKKNIDCFIRYFQLKRINVQEDGLCFINCLVLYHKYYFNKFLTIDSLKTLYYNYFVTHPIINLNSDDYESELLLNLSDYFDNKNYNTDICDYIINETPELFKITMFILNLDNAYICSINKMTHESIVTNKEIYLIRDGFTNC